jgi:hypothetical protein
VIETIYAKRHMNNILESPLHLRIRRAQLILQIHHERLQFQQQAAQFQQSFATVDQGVEIGNRLRQQPLLLIGLCVAGIIIKPRRLFWAAKLGMKLWQFKHRFSN